MSNAHSPKTVSRRTLLKTIGVGAVAAAFPALAHAQSYAGRPAGNGTAFKRFRVGDFQVTVIQDRVVDFVPSMFSLGAPEGGVESELARANLPTDRIPTTVNPFVVDTGDRLVLLDTGTGPFLGETFGGLLDTLDVLGIAREDVDTVVISHWHPDHTGAASVDGAITFPNARYLFPRLEWEFVQDFPAESSSADMYPAFEMAMQPLFDGGAVAFYDDGDEIVPGITAVAAPGHTPGHHGFDIRSNGRRLVSLVDTADNFLVSLAHPEWGFVFDHDLGLASETRRALLARAADEGLQVMGYHFPFPGVGYVVRAGDGFRFVPSV
jgi:glyoxylase-like metal-dependent hydrolase (beta-lactamase superfamily II)